MKNFDFDRQVKEYMIYCRCVQLAKKSEVPRRELTFLFA